MLLALLPLLTLISLFTWLNKLHPTWGWRRSFLRALVIWGVWIVATTELLSLLDWLSRAGVGLSWGIFLIVCIVGIARDKQPWSIRKPAGLNIPNSLFLVPLAIIFFLTAVVAWLAPPDITDSLNYHLPRVAHWAQNRSVEHFASGIEQQNSRPPFAEYAILHFYVLAQGDRLVNVAAWLAMFGSVIGISLVAALLGANITGQLTAAIFSATLPMGIIQASSTMNDYVVGLWLVCVAEEFLLLLKIPGPTQLPEVAFLTAAAGLAIATKPTAYAYLLPFAIATAVWMIKKLSLVNLIRYCSAGIVICFTINAGHLLRNTLTYGNPIDPGQTVIHLNEMRDWKGLSSNIMRNAGLHLSTPWQQVNYQITRLIQAIHFKIGVALDDPRTTAHGEFWVRPITATVPVNTAPNSLHTYLLVVLVILALIRYKLINPLNTIYLGLVLASFIILSLIFKWQIFGSRYHLPFFVLISASAGALLTRLLPKWLGYAVVLLLSFSAAWPLFGHETQPLLTLLERTTLSNSTSPSYLLESYPNLSSPESPYRQIASRIQENGCHEIYLALGGNSQEYLWWIVLGAPDRQMKIEWLVAGTPSAIHKNLSVEPCAVICEECASQASMRDLPRAFSVGANDLYMLP